MEHDQQREEQFLTIFLRNEEDLKSYARALLPTWEAVDDAMQEASLVMWRKMDQLRDPSEFLPWAKVIVRFECLKARRTVARDRHWFTDEVLDLLADHETDPGEEKLAREREALEFCLGKLDAAQRDLVLLLYRGHGAGSVSWNRHGKPILGMPNPVAMYHKLFSGDTMPLEQRIDLLADERSALDTVLSDAKSMKKGLTKSDVDKLDEYFESIREIETRISKDEQWLNVPKKTPANPVNEPSESLEGAPAVEMIYDLMLAAMQVDASRVFTYRLPSDSFVESIGSSYTAHNLSHYSGAAERTEDSKLRDRTHAELIAGFITKMKASAEADGSSLFDNVALTFGSNLRVTHSLNNCPTLIAGGGAGFKHGRHLVIEKEETPLCNLWLSTLKGCGVQAESFGDSNGVIEELFHA